MILVFKELSGNQEIEEKVILIDSGLGSEKTIKDQLGSKKIDITIITHWDQDHYIGIYNLYLQNQLEYLYNTENGEKPILYAPSKFEAELLKKKKEAYNELGNFFDMKVMQPNELIPITSRVFKMEALSTKERTPTNSSSIPTYLHCYLHKNRDKSLFLFPTTITT